MNKIEGKWSWSRNPYSNLVSGVFTVGERFGKVCETTKGSWSAEVSGTKLETDSKSLAIHWVENCCGEFGEEQKTWYTLEDENADLRILLAFVLGTDEVLTTDKIAKTAKEIRESKGDFSSWK